MKKLLPLLAWLTVSNPVVEFDDNGQPVAVSVCAEDSAAGPVCVFVTKDNAGRPVAVNAQGDLANKSSVRLALRAELLQARNIRLNVIAKQSDDAARRSLIALPVTTADLQ